MELKKVGAAGTYESSDIYVTLFPNEGNGIDITLKSSVEKQFGVQIRKVIKETLERLGVSHVKVQAEDTGALDCIIRARVETAAYRAAEITENFDWKELDKWTN